MAKKMFVSGAIWLLLLGFLPAAAYASSQFNVNFGAPGTLLAGQSASISLSVANGGAAYANAVVDVEIYSASGGRVFQQFFENQNFAQNSAQNYSVNWTPGAAGTYTVKAGVFAPNWSQILYWTDNAASLAVAAQSSQFSIAVSSNPSSPVAGRQASIGANVYSQVSLTGSTVDFEIYDAAGNKAYQQFYGNQNFGAGETKTFGASWTPAATGAYTVKAGIFNGSWTQLYYWADNALTVNVVPPAPAVSQTGSQITLKVPNPGTLTAGTAAPLSLSVTNNGGNSSNNIVDVEIFNSENSRLLQQFFTDQNLGQNSTQTYSFNWIPAAAGTYTVKAGVFGANWSSLIAWSENAATFSVQPAASAPLVSTALSLSLPLASVVGDPLSGISFYVDPNSPASQQIAAWATSDPTDATRLKVIASGATASWFGNWNANVQQDVQNYTAAAQNQGTLPTLVAYNIPQRDCGGFSAGGANNPDGYKAWIRSFAAGIGGKKAVVILEPDALAGMDCLSQADQQTRTQLLTDAVQVLKGLGNTRVYLDAGNPSWIAAGQMASRLNAADIGQADGFSLNVSNFLTTSDNVQYGTQVSALTGSKHFVIDTSRNGNGSDGNWCNPSGRALGAQPTASTGNQLVDAFMWIKRPGESDGSCNGGPSAGVWWPQYAVGLAANAGY